MAKSTKATGGRASTKTPIALGDGQQGYQTRGGHYRYTSGPNAGQIYKGPAPQQQPPAAMSGSLPGQQVDYSKLMQALMPPQQMNQPPAFTGTPSGVPRPPLQAMNGMPGQLQPGMAPSGVPPMQAGNAPWPQTGGAPGALAPGMAPFQVPKLPGTGIPN